jgi:hypothetical protein
MNITELRARLLQEQQLPKENQNASLMENIEKYITKQREKNNKYKNTSRKPTDLKPI